MFKKLKNSLFQKGRWKKMSLFAMSIELDRLGFEGADVDEANWRRRRELRDADHQRPAAVGAFDQPVESKWLCCISSRFNTMFNNEALSDVSKSLDGRWQLLFRMKK